MRRTMWVLSLLAPIVNVVAGLSASVMIALLPAFSDGGGGGIAIYYAPVGIIITSIGLIPGVTLALIGLLMGILDGARNHRGLWLWGQVVWPLIVVLFTIIFFRSATLVPFWWTVATVLSLPSLLYGFLAPQQGVPMPRKHHRQISFVAILSAVVIAGVITILISPVGETPQTGGGSQNLPAPSVLTASAASPNADCAHGTFPLITLQNPSVVAVTWSAKSVTDDAAPLVLTPARGTLAAHSTVEVKINGKTTGAAVGVQFDDPSGASPAVVKFVCGPEK